MRIRESDRSLRHQANRRRRKAELRMPRRRGYASFERVLEGYGRELDIRFCVRDAKPSLTELHKRESGPEMKNNSKGVRFGSLDRVGHMQRSRRQGPPPGVHRMSWKVTIPVMRRPEAYRRPRLA